MNNKLFYGAALAWVLTAAPGLAQTATASDDVIVTATKRATSLQNTAVAVTPVSEAKLQAQNVVSISELTRVAPSLNFVPAPSNATTMFVIRGISTFAFNDALEQSVGLVLDGVPLSRLVGSVGDMVDVGQVQVLRGPQGTLFGKNATGGVISVDTRDPTFTQSFDGRVFYGSHDEKRFQGTANLPLIEDKLALRVSGWKFSRDGYIDAPYQPKGELGGFDNQGARVKVALVPTDNWRVDVGSEYTNNHFDGSTQTTRGRVINKATGLIFNGNTGLENAIQTIDRALGMVDGPENLTSFKAVLDHSWSRQSRNTVKSVATFGDIDFTVIGGYIDTHQWQTQPTDYTNSFFVGAQCGALGFTASRCIGQPGQTVYRSDILQRTVEARIANNDDSALKYTAGLFYYDTNIATGSDAQSPLANTTNGSAITRTARWARLYMNTDVYAAFSDVSYTFGKAEAFAGLRYSHERSGGSFIRTPSAIFPGAQSTTTATELFLSVAAQPLETNDLSYRAGLQYHVTDEVMLYASTNRAYKGPGFNFGPTLTAAQFAQNGAVVEKEVAKSYEIGARTRFFDRQLTLNLTGFYSPFTNFQVTAVLPTTPTSFASVNAPELVAQGIEAEFSIAPKSLEGFVLDGSVVWNDTHYGDFANAPCYTGQVNNGTFATSPGVGRCYTIAAGQQNAGATVQDVTDLRAVASPEWQVSLNPSYEYNFDKYRLFTSLNYLYTSDTQYGVNDNPDSIQEAYSTVDMRVGIGSSDQRWTLTAYGRNLTDERFATRISVANPTVNQSIPFQALQTFGVALDVSF